ncbi:MAG: FG-GAP-like repeat-containing protein [Myxococcota bacterium]
MLVGLAAWGCQAPEPVVTPDVLAPRASADDWQRALDERFAAEARAIRPNEGAFRASVPGADAGARFDAAGVQFTGRAGTEAWSLRTVAWGRDDAHDPIAPRAPTLGACTNAQAVDGRCIQRLEYDAPGITEWWTARDRGLQQGWRVPTPPAGTGPLHIDLAIEGSLATEVRADHAEITDGAGRAWRMGGLAAWDATGAALPVWLEPTDQGLAVHVDDAGAAYPVEIDPVYETAAWSASGRPSTSPSFTYRVASAGDVNRDGVEDLVVSSYDYWSGFGAAFVFYGRAGGPSYDAVTRLDGDYMFEFGRDAAGAGDVDGDGYDDVIVGARRDGTGGRAHVFYGSASGISSDAGTTLGTATSLEFFGSAVCSAGDVDGDGYADVVVGAPRVGRVDLFRGGPAGTETTATTSLSASAATQFGLTACGVGDVDGDGHDDVAVSDDLGNVRVFRGGASGLSTTSLVSFFPGSRESLAGYPVIGGDVNADGFSDVLVGANGWLNVYHGAITGPMAAVSTRIAGGIDETTFGDALAAGDVDGDGADDVLVGVSGRTAGAALLFLGGPSGLDATVDASLVGETTGDEFGAAVALADADGDGLLDAVVGAPAYDIEAGRMYHFRGTGSGLSTAAAATVTGEPDGNKLGYVIGPAGDVDADGYADVLVTAPGYESSTGAAFLFHGSATGLLDEPTTTLVAAGASQFGYAAAALGDSDADGYDDVAIGHYGQFETPSVVRVYHGSASGLEPAPRVSVTLATDATSTFGNALAGPGDVNGDGYDDLVVGDVSSSARVGAGYVFLGSASGIRTSSYTVLARGLTTRGLGDYVGRAGDVNGDGYADVLVGQPSHESSTGRVVVYLGSSTGVDETADTILLGEATGNWFGISFDAAGDLDGDGFDDVIVGEPRSGLGRALVFHGSASGLSATPAATITGTTTNDTFAYVLAGAGDLDGDGYDDVVVLDTGTGSSGIVGIYGGSASGLDTTARRTLSSRDPTQIDGYGFTLGRAGDVDGDGFDDLLIGAAGDDRNAGRVDLHLGCADADRDGACAPVDCDDADATTAGVFTAYRDGDGDGYGAAEVTVCALTPGYTTTRGDCDDDDATVHPGATERCDAADFDEDCDGRADDADDAPAGPTTAYLDGDGDGYGSSAATWCDVPAGYVGVGGDCDDGAAVISPGAPERCDPADVDEDCDGVAEDADTSATGQTAYVLDADGDGYGGTTPVYACDLSPGMMTDSTDCDDADAGVSPAGREVCDPADRDENCDGLADDADPSATGASRAYADADGDGFGGWRTAWMCDLAAGYTATSLDCDDTSAAISPAGSEVCDVADADEDCDGLVEDADPSATGQTTVYRDVDGDGFGGVTASACDLASGYAAVGADCDDADAAFHPGAAEPDCTDANDYDCDGVSPRTDADADGWAACVDCDDTDPDVHPEAPDAAGDGMDSDCDAVELCYVDADEDGYHDEDGATIPSDDPSCSGLGEALATEPAGDCDDADPRFHPAAEESDCADSADYNCDGSVGYADADADGFAACVECDDADAAAHPEAVEIAGDGIDQDCDGADLPAPGDTADEPPIDPPAAGCPGCSGAPGAGTGIAVLLGIVALSRRRTRAPEGAARVPRS